MAPPATPSCGNGPKPKIRQGDSGTSSAAPATVTTAVIAVLPVPRRMFASTLKLQIRITPPNTMLE